MRVTAKSVIDFAFQSLMIQIDNNNIKPGTKEERDFLTLASESALFDFMKTNNVHTRPVVTVRWNPLFPEDLTVSIDDRTVQLLKDRGLYD